MDDDAFRESMAESIREHVGTALDPSVKQLMERLYYMPIISTTTTLTNAYARI